MSFLSDMSDDRLEIILGYSFGFIVMIANFVLAIAIALGHVTKEGSFGLEIVLASFGTLGGAFVGWAFGKSKRS